MQLYFIRHAQSTNNVLYNTSQDWSGRSEDPDLSPLGFKQADLLAEALCNYPPQAKAPARGSQSGPTKEGQSGPTKESQPGLSGEGQSGPTGEGYDGPSFEKGFGLTHIYCSLMVRSIATARPAARALGLPLVAWYDLHETGGIFLGETPEEYYGIPGNPRSFFEQHFPELILPENLNGDGWWNKPHEPRQERLPRARRVLSDLWARHGASEDRVAIVSHGDFYIYFMSVLFGVPEIQPWLQMHNTGISRIDFRPDGSANVLYCNRTDFIPADMLTA